MIDNIPEPLIGIFVLCVISGIVWGSYMGIDYGMGFREATKTEYNSARVYSMYSPKLKDMAQEALEDGILTANEVKWLGSEFLKQIDETYEERKNKELQEAKEKFTDAVYKEE